LERNTLSNIPVQSCSVEFFVTRAEADVQDRSSMLELGQ